MKTLIFLYPLTQHQLETDELKIGLQQVTVSECYGMGRIYTAQDLVDKDLDKFIPTEIEKQNPRWKIAEGRCATEVLKLKGIKKVLINPHVIEQESDVSDFDKDNTWGFFDALHERGYENFCCRFNNAAFYPMDDELSLFYIKEIVEAAIEE